MGLLIDTDVLILQENLPPPLFSKEGDNLSFRKEGYILPLAKGGEEGLFDADGVARLVRADRDGRSDAAYTTFAVVCIEVWCRIFLDSYSGREAEG